MFHVLALCRNGLAGLADTPLGLPASLFLAGLGGSALHCVGMCGPFVLGQVMGDAEQIGAGTHYGEWRRLRGAALVPYHGGRLVTYTALGALAGAATSMFVAGEAFGWVATVFLILGAGLMIAQAFGLALGTTLPHTAIIQRLAGPLAASRHPAARFSLGLVLGFLPCGLIYGALGAAAGTGSSLEGALAMAAFSLGTMPALIVVGWGGALLRRRFRETVRWIATPLLLISSTLMLALAVQRF